MAEPAAGRNDPFSDMISIVAGPIAAVIRSFEQLRRGADDLMKGLENFNATMENLNETAGRVNRLLNDFEEPVRAMLPQLTRVVQMAEDVSARMSGPLDQVVPGITRLAETLNSPVLRTLPTDLGQFMDVVNDLARRLSPLGQIAEQAGGLFGLRIPGFPARPSSRATAPAPPVSAMTIPPAPPAKRAPAKRAAATASTARKATAKKATSKKVVAKRSTTKKKSTARMASRG
ncbi:MAG: hypothetical protein H0U21_09405 [Acidimicrobiia bacterium]|nr:hypothetical protein [Acidimicrobiia bacterium]